MAEKKIELFLSENSALHTDIPQDGATKIDLKNKRRPDKIFGRTGMMKWAMVLNGVDSPYMLNPGCVVYHPNTPALRTEINELEEFKI